MRWLKGALRYAKQKAIKARGGYISRLRLRITHDTADTSTESTMAMAKP